MAYFSEATAALFGGLIPLVVVLVLIGAVFIVLTAQRNKSASGKADVYYLRKTLFSPAERSLLGVLESVLPGNMRVFGKVRIEDILGVKKGLAHGARQAARNRINRKHVDFLLVRVADLSPLAAIELDDRSHEAEDRQQRDAFVDAAMSGAGLPVIRFPAQQAYLPAEIKVRLQQIVGQQ